VKKPPAGVARPGAGIAGLGGSFHGSPVAISSRGRLFQCSKFCEIHKHLRRRKALANGTQTQFGEFQPF
jgi:hypothetical protein